MAELTQLARAIYDARIDLQRHFPEPEGADEARYLAWLLSHGRVAYGLSAGELRVEQALWQAAVREHLAPRARLAAMRTSAAAHAGVAGVLSWIEDIVHRKPGPSRTEPGCNLVGYARAETGVGQTVRAAAASAQAAGLGTAVISVRPDGRQSELDTSVRTAGEPFPYRASIFYVNADQVEAAMRQVGRGYRAGRLNIGNWVWELEEFPAYWRGAARMFDQLWAPSRFCQQAVERVCAKPVALVPYAIQMEPGSERPETPPGVFTFLTMFDMLSVFERKNPLALIRAFAREFRPGERVRLVVKVSHAGTFGREMARMREAAAGANVVFEDRTLRKAEVNALLAACDCFVSLHRAEGFGLCLAEAMWLGKAVIATNYSGNTDFMNEQNSFPVDYRMCEVGAGSAPYNRASRWADPSIDDAARQMRLVVENAELRKRRAAAGQAFVRAHLSPEAVGRQMAARLGQYIPEWR